MNPIAVLSLISALSCFLIGCIVLARFSYGTANKLFGILSLLFSYWAFPEFMYRSVSDYHMAEHWMSVSFFWPIIISVALHFVLVITERKKILAHPMTYLVLYLPAFIISVFAFTTDWMSLSPDRQWWGYVFEKEDISFVSIFKNVWFFSLYLFGAVSLFQALLKLGNPYLRNQILTVLFAFFVPTILYILDIYFRQTGMKVPELTSVGMFFSSVIIYFFLVQKDRFFFNEENVALNTLALMKEMVVVTDRRGLITHVNPAFVRLVDGSQEGIVGRRLDEIVPAMSRNEPREGYSLVQLRLDADRSYDVLLFIVAMKDHFRKTKGYVHILTDISARKKSEEKIRLRSHLLDMTNDACFLSNAEGSFLYVNAAAERIFGYSQQEFLELKTVDLFVAGSAGLLDEKFRELSEKGSVCFEFVGRNRVGERLELEASISRSYQQGKAVNIGIVRDITHRKNLEAERKSVEVMQAQMAAVEALGFCVVLVAMDRRIIFANDAFLRLTGYTRLELVGKDSIHVLSMIVKEEFQKPLFGAMQGMLEGVKSYPVRFILQDAKGKEIPVLCSSDFVREPDGNPSGIMVTLKDISDIQEIEKELAAEKELLSITLRNVHEAVITTDYEGRIILMNGSAEALFSTSVEKAMSMEISSLLKLNSALESDGLGDNPVTTIMAKKEHQDSEFLVNYLNIHGQERKLTLSCSRFIRGEGGHGGFVFTLRDVTEKMKQDEHMLRSQKLESLGILAGGIAHDFNNILTSIIGNISLARMTLENPDEMAEVLREAEKAGLRAKGLTRQLLTFSRGGEPVKKPVDIASLLMDTVVFSLRGTSAKPSFEIATDLPLLELDEEQISQVINNLVINAVQSMPSGGIVTVAADQVVLDVENPETLPSGSYVRIIVKDQGEGIPRELITKVFDPYFTTKKKGTGLGLATALSIVKKHSGNIRVDSAIQKGTSIIIHLPIGEFSRKVERETGVDEIIRGKGRLLVMDDEDEICSFLSKTLTLLGYDVEVSGDGQVALEKFRKVTGTSASVECVILDLTVPGGMGGKELVKILKDLDPGLKAIVSSGYSQDPVMASPESYGFDAVVEKPYDIVTLSQTVSRMIRERRKM